MRIIEEKENALHTQANYRLVEALSASEARYRGLLENLSEVVYALDNRLRITFLNRAWVTLMGFELDKSLGRPLKEFIFSEDHFKIDALFREDKATKHEEIRLISSDGTAIWFDISVRQESSGLDSGFSGTLININERKLATLALKASEERYQMVACAANDGIWDWDLITDKVYLSPRWKAQLGYDDQEIESSFSTWYSRVHPQDIDEAMSAVMDCLEGRTPHYESLHRLRHRDGSYRWIFDRGVVLRDTAGIPLRLAGSHADVTLLKSVEDALVIRERELEAIFSISPDGIVTVTREGLVSSVNPAFETLTGLNKKELVGIAEGELNARLAMICDKRFPFEPDEPDSATNRPGNLFGLDSRKVRPQLLRRRSYGESMIRLSRPKVRVLKRLVRRMQGQEISKVMYFRDVTIETEVDRMKSEFLSTAAHELRTPMASVYGFSELLLMRKFSPEATHEILQTIHSQSSSLVKMLNELLDLARIEARAGRDFVFAEINVHELIRRSVAGLMVPGDARKVKLARFKSKSPKILGDAEKLQQALTNVLSNAYKYSPHGGEIEVRTDTYLDVDLGRRIAITVADHGVGMTQEQLSHVYERFWRADTSGKYPGTGLGMSLVKEIMDIHQAEIEILSTFGLGTTVKLWFTQITDQGETYEDPHG